MLTLIEVNLNFQKSLTMNYFLVTLKGTFKSGLSWDTRIKQELHHPVAINLIKEEESDVMLKFLFPIIYINFELLG